MSTENTVIETLVKAGKPLKAGEIAEMTGIDKKDVAKAIKTLKTEEKIFSPKFLLLFSEVGIILQKPITKKQTYD